VGLDSANTEAVCEILQPVGLAWQQPAGKGAGIDEWIGRHRQVETAWDAAQNRVVELLNVMPNKRGIA
jgi:hypothetical protein